MDLALLSSSIESFADAAAEFFAHLSQIRWTPFAVALVLLAVMQVVRAWAWRNTLRAAYPGTRISFLRLNAAYLVGAGINAVVPAHAGDVTKVFLAKRQIPQSSYPAVTSSFLAQTIFDTTAGVLVLLYGVTQGLLPEPPRLPDLPAFEISFWAAHPIALLITAVALAVATVVGVLLLAQRVRRFWERVRQGLIILAEPRRYLREVASWQGAGWLCRFGAFWFFLSAFGLHASFNNVMLVMGVQSIANVIPFTPGGAGAQQALLVATLAGPSATAVLSFSVGTQIAMVAWSVVLGFAAIQLVFRTGDWRGLMQQARAEAESEGIAQPQPSTARGS